MDMRTGLTAVPHPGLGFHFLRVPVGNQRTPGVFKRRSGPKRKETNDDRGSNRLTTVRAHLQNSLALYVKIGVKACQRHNQAGTSRRRSLPDISHIAALFIGQSTATWDCPPAAKRKTLKARTIQKDPCDSKGYTHTGDVLRTELIASSPEEA